MNICFKSVGIKVVKREILVLSKQFTDETYNWKNTLCLEENTLWSIIVHFLLSIDEKHFPFFENNKTKIMVKTVHIS